MPFDAASQHANVHCTACPVRSRCVAGCARLESALAEGPATVIPLPHPGKTLYAAGTQAFAIFVVRAGCVKTVTHDADGNEHVRGFHFPGDLVGLDALGASNYPSSAIAVSAAQVCRLSKGQLHQMAKRDAAQSQWLLESTSRELREALALSGNFTAEQRVAAFLLAMQERLATAAGNGFELPMTRRDIANHLRLATETVCRVLGRFADHGWLRGGSTLKVLRPRPLAELAQPVGIGGCAEALAA